MLDVATSGHSLKDVPLRAWAAVAWSSSEHWRPKRAVDAIEFTSPLDVQRGLCAGFRKKGGDVRSSRHFQHLSNVSPDLEPSLRYALRV